MSGIFLPKERSLQFTVYNSIQGNLKSVRSDVPGCSEVVVNYMLHLFSKNYNSIALIMTMCIDKVLVVRISAQALKMMCDEVGVVIGCGLLLL